MQTMLQEIEKNSAAAYAEARARYESWATTDYPDVPSDATDALQVMLARWQRRNFGLPRDAEIALGIVAELGETVEAGVTDAAADGVGDVIVYCGQLALSNRMAIAPALDLAQVRGRLEFRDVPIAMGRLAHCVLKRQQKIRGMDDDEAFRRALFARMTYAIAAIADDFEEACGMGSVRNLGGLAGIYAEVGGRVLKRDWKKDAAKGGEA